MEEGNYKDSRNQWNRKQKKNREKSVKQSWGFGNKINKSQARMIKGKKMTGHKLTVLGTRETSLQIKDIEGIL